MKNNYTINSDNKYLGTFHKDIYKGPLKQKIKDFTGYTNDLKNKHFYQYQRELVKNSGHRAVINDTLSGKTREMIMMASNNYLEMTTHPEVIEAGINALKKYGSGSGGPPLLSGTMDLHKKLEARIAKFKGCEDCMIFTSGYGANLGIISSIVGKKDVMIIDKLNHASIIDGYKLSESELLIYPHLNIKKLEEKLKKIPKSKNILVITDGVFSMDGDIAPLDKITELKKKYDFLFMVDDAHGTGTIGQKGKGTPNHFNVEKKIDLIMGTFSKSMGGVGGFLASSKEIINYIRHYARSHIFSVTMPPANVACLDKAFEILERDGDALVNRLQTNIKYIRDNLKSKGIRLSGNELIPIIPIIIGDELLLRKIHRDLHYKNIFVNAVPYPVVPKKECRLRLSILTTHTKNELDITADTINELFNKYGIK